MNTRVVRPEVIWAVLAMEAGLALPIMSVTAQGERTRGSLPTLLVSVPAAGGLFCVLRFVERVARPGVARPGRASHWPSPGACRHRRRPGEGPAVALARFLQIVVPAALAFALWWRGGALADAELTSEEVRSEFLVAGSAMLLLLVVFHGMVPAIRCCWACAVGLFTVGRAAGHGAGPPGRRRHRVAAVRGRVLAVLVGVLPARCRVLDLGLLRPNIMAAFWFGLGRLHRAGADPARLVVRVARLALARAATSRPAAAAAPATADDSADFARWSDQQRLPDWVAWASLTLVFLLVLFMAAGDPAHPAR